MPFIQFPNIPALPGVPDLPRLPSIPNPNAIIQGALGAVQGALWRTFQTDAQWGIFDKAGKALGDPQKTSGILGALLTAVGAGGGDTLLSNVSTEYAKEMRVSDFPVEKGGFASYNKVESPSQPIVTLSFTGSVKERGDFLTAIDKAVKSTDLYSVATPEVTYVNHTLERYNYQRAPGGGANMLLVEIVLKEIRQVASQYTKAGATQTANAKSAAAVPQADAGKVQPQSPVQSVLKSVATKLGF